jgi:histidinol-phosphate aminotransferase
MEALKSIKENVRNLRAYSLAPDRARVKLNQNENPWGVPHAVRKETLRRLDQLAWSRYPDFVPERLHEQLADFAGWTADGIIAGNGSNELIQALLMTSIEPGKQLLISEPTFALYRQIGTVLGGEVVSVPLSQDLTYDAPALISEVKSSAPDVTIICSPNNPTGCVLEPADLESLLKTSNGLVVVDEAYHEFSGQSVVPLLRRHENLVVLRTFSKAMGMAGLRVGYLLAAPALVIEIRKAVLPYNLNVVSQTAAEVALELYESEFKPVIKKIIEARDSLYADLRQIDGLEPVPSRANFMLVRSELNPRFVFAELLRRDILVRDVSKYPMLSNYFRFSVGTTNENEQLLSALHEICKGGTINQ